MSPEITNVNTEPPVMKQTRFGETLCGVIKRSGLSLNLLWRELLADPSHRSDLARLYFDPKAASDLAGSRARELLLNVSGQIAWQVVNTRRMTDRRDTVASKPLTYQAMIGRIGRRLGIGFAEDLVMATNDYLEATLRKDPKQSGAGDSDE